LIVAVLFIGMVLFFLGVIGEYVGGIYEETKGRPQYIIAARPDDSGRRRETWIETREYGRLNSAMTMRPLQLL